MISTFTAFNFPSFDVGVPASVVFAAGDVDVGGHRFANGQARCVDFIAPLCDADFFRVLLGGFNHEIAFAPRAVFALARLFRKDVCDGTGDGIWHGVWKCGSVEA